MAHEIDMTTRSNGAAFYVREPAWHGLGTVVQEAQTSEEAIRLAGLDWQVKPFPLFAQVGDGMVEVKNRVANVRTDTGAVLGVVGEGYRVYQNAEAFAFMDNIVQEKLAIWDTAGSLKGGRRVWMLAKLPRTVEVAKNDLVDAYVLITNAHDGSMALRILPTTVRVVCNNTLNLALSRGSEGLFLSHHSSLDKRVEEARSKLGIITRRMDEFSDQTKALARKSLSSSELRDYFTKLVEGRSEKSQKELLDRLVTNLGDPTNDIDGVRGTAWAAYNAVSLWADHQLHRDAHSERRLTSVWFGVANRIKQRAFQEALTMVN